MTYEFIQVSIENHVAKVILNRVEKRNAMHGEFIHELLHVIKSLAANSEVRVLLISGNGEHFCSGADIAWMKKMSEASYEQNYDDAQYLADLMYQIYYFPKPTIILVHGATMGGGLGLVAACDIAIAADTARFSFSEVKIGIAPSAISPYVLAAMGERAARYYFLTADQFDAHDAYRMGLVHRLVNQQELMLVGMAVATSLLQNSSVAMTEAKQLIQRVANNKIDEGLAQKTAEHLARLRTSKDAREGLSAFLEKRQPKW